MYSEEILDFARKALGDEKNGGTLAALCGAAGAELISRLREGVSPGDIKEQFITAAGVLALSMYMSIDDSLFAGEMKAGSLSFKKDGGGVSAHRLRQQAEAILGTYLKDSGFAFMGVE